MAAVGRLGPVPLFPIWNNSALWLLGHTRCWKARDKHRGSEARGDLMLILGLWESPLKASPLALCYIKWGGAASYGTVWSSAPCMSQFCLFPHSRIAPALMFSCLILIARLIQCCRRRAAANQPVPFEWHPAKVKLNPVQCAYQNVIRPQPRASCCAKLVFIGSLTHGEEHQPNPAMLKQD